MSVLFYVVAITFLLFLASANAGPLPSMLIVLAAAHLGACAFHEFLSG
jgi:hypothetical protein